MREQGAGTIEDYTSTAGATRQWAKDTNYAQAGDPVKAAKVIVDLAGRESLPALAEVVPQRGYNAIVTARERTQALGATTLLSRPA